MFNSLDWYIKEAMYTNHTHLARFIPNGIITFPEWTIIPADSIGRKPTSYDKGSPTRGISQSYETNSSSRAILTSVKLLKNVPGFTP
jgi:hypothetical protein